MGKFLLSQNDINNHIVHSVDTSKLKVYEDKPDHTVNGGTILVDLWKTYEKSDIGIIDCRSRNST